MERSTRKFKDKSEWIITDGEHKTFISDELFRAAQERDQATIRPGRKSRPASTYKHWLAFLYALPAVVDLSDVVKANQAIHIFNVRRIITLPVTNHTLQMKTLLNQPF